MPEYVIKGDAERGIKPLAPDLKSVADLARYKDVFRDPEDPSKGRFLNSPTGWTSEIVNSQKLKAYGLTDTFVNFRTGSGAALDAEVASSIRRGKPVLFYYWSPTPLLGRFKLIKLEEPAFNADAWKTLADANNPHPIGTRSMPARLAIGVSAPFKAQYPQLVSVFEKVDLPIDLLNGILGEMSEKRTPPRQVAEAFLKSHPDIWQQWVPADVAAKTPASAAALAAPVAAPLDAPVVAQAAPAPAPAPVVHKRVVHHTQVAQARPAYNDDGYRDTAYREPARQPQPAPAPAQPNYVGIGTGAVIGGLIGNQVGGGRGKALATVAGVIGGGMLGNAVQNQVQQPQR